MFMLFGFALLVLGAVAALFVVSLLRALHRQIRFAAMIAWQSCRNRTDKYWYKTTTAWGFLVVTFCLAAQCAIIGLIVSWLWGPHTFHADHVAHVYVVNQAMSQMVGFLAGMLFGWYDLEVFLWARQHAVRGKVVWLSSYKRAS